MNGSFYIALLYLKVYTSSHYITDLMWNVLFKAPCRRCQSGASTESPVLGDSLMPLHLLLLASGEWTPPSSSVPPLSVFSPSQVHSHSREELWRLTLPTFLSIITLGASFIRLSSFKNSSSNSIQIPGGFALFVPPLRAAWGLLSP